jgi:3-hydroxypropanoate dehydrogenase
VPRLFPHYPAMRDMFVKNPQLIQETALRNSTLQGAYMILAARVLGLDCGPMSGFDNAKLDEEFFAAGKCESCEQEFFPEGHVKSNFLCNIGYGDPATLMPRGPRLDFSEACTLLGLSFTCARTRSSIATVALAVRPMSVIERFSIMPSWKDDGLTGS